MVLYFYLHQKVGEPSFKEKSRDGIMSITEIKWRMFQWKIPECLKPLIIKIWEDMGIVKKVDRRNIKFLKTDFDIENMGKICSELGIIPED